MWWGDVMIQMWYDRCPTVWNNQGVILYINATPQMKEQLAKNAPEWLALAEKKAEWPMVVTRAAVAPMLEKVDAKLITDAKLNVATTDVAAPKTGTVEEKEKAVQVKLATVIRVAEWEKVLALRATVKVVELIDVKTVNP